MTTNTETQLLWVNTIDNAIDSLEKAAHFADEDNVYKWKWIVFALHHSLYAFCIACLENGNYKNVLIGKDGAKSHIYSRDEKNFKKSKKHPIDKACGLYKIQWEPVPVNLSELESKVENSNKREQGQNREKLISFPTALARVMDGEFWMARLMITRPLVLSDDEICNIGRLLDWRNDFMHFIPKLEVSTTREIQVSCATTLKAIEFLAFKSYACITKFNDEREGRTKKAVNALSAILDYESII